MTPPKNQRKNTTIFTENEKQFITTRILTFITQSGSCPGKIYGKDKVHKIYENDTVD